MSYTGVGVIGDHIAREVSALGTTGNVAARDITRVNHLGQTVILVPKGQPIPSGLAVEQDEAAPPPARDTNVARPPFGRPAAEPDIGGQQRRATHLERMFTLAEWSRS